MRVVVLATDPEDGNANSTACLARCADKGRTSLASSSAGISGSRSPRRASATSPSSTPIRRFLASFARGDAGSLAAALRQLLGVAPRPGSAARRAIQVDRRAFRLTQRRRIAEAHQRVYRRVLGAAHR